MTVIDTRSGVLPGAIGPYVITGRLGEGGMGAVYRAVKKDDPGTEVALKVILASLTEDEETLKRFQREAKLLESLRHANIVSLLDVGVDRNQRYFAMELLEGVPLSAYKARPFPETIPLFIQVCKGMQYLAERSIVHRDLSPSNVLVSKGPDGSPLVKVLDFGIAKNVEAHGTLDSFTKTGLVMGKPAYWSPEQLGVLGPGETIDWRSDVYALGVIFYLVLSGQLPISADSPYSFAAKHLSERPDPVVAAPGNPPLPAILVELVEKMLEKKRENRPSNYGEILSVLEHSLAEGTTGRGRVTQTAKITVPLEGDQTKTTNIRENDLDAEPDVVFTTPGIPDAFAKAPKKAFPAVPFVGGAAAVVLLAAGTWFVLRERPQPVNPITDVKPTVAATAGPVVPGQEGRLSLFAFPWARVLLVKEASSGKVVPLPPDMTTPVVIDLGPGEYQIDLASGTSGERRQVAVSVAAGQVVEYTENFETPAEALARLD